MQSKSIDWFLYDSNWLFNELKSQAFLLINQLLHKRLIIFSMFNLKLISEILLKYINPFWLNVSFHIGTSHLFCSAEQNDWFPCETQHWVEMGEAIPADIGPAVKKLSLCQNY